MDLVRDGGDQAAQKVPRGATRHLLVHLDEGELRRSVDGDEQVKLALRSSNLGDVDMKTSNVNSPGVAGPKDEILSSNIAVAIARKISKNLLAIIKSPTQHELISPFGANAI